GKLQALASVPLQLPAHGPAPPHDGRLPTGGPLTGAQVPRLFGRLHAEHWPVQAVPQQTPSTQKPDRHWVDAVQAWPLAIVGTHTRFATSQRSPAMHWLSPVQLVRQTLTPHTNGVQLTVDFMGQAPWPLQVAPSTP